MHEKRMKKWMLGIGLWLVSFVAAWSQTAERDSLAGADSLVVSLITCDPGADAYKLFGHTGIRVRNKREADMDFVFNYGMFRLSEGNFILRFVKGETDYELGIEPAPFFFGRYSATGIGTTEQVLALSAADKALLWRLLVVNYEPQNRVYRYNFLYDNCTTRALDMLERAVGADRMRWPNYGQPCTFRQIVHEFTAGSPWTELGIDMVLGTEVDRPLTEREQLFIPSRLMAALRDVRIVAEGAERPLVAAETEYEAAGEPETIPDFPLSPVALMAVLLALMVALSVADVCWRRTPLSLMADLLLLSVQLTAGLIIAFLFFFSEHPAVGSNWLVLAFNPLVFVMMTDVIRMHHKGHPLVAVGPADRRMDLLELVNLAVLVFTALLFWLPLQWLGLAQLLLVLSLLTRSVARLLCLPVRNPE